MVTTAPERPVEASPGASPDETPAPRKRMRRISSMVLGLALIVVVIRGIYVVIEVTSQQTP